MKRHKILSSNFVFVIVFVFLLIFSSDSLAARKKKSSSIGSCRVAILSNSTTGKRLYGKDINRRVFPASTTKVMTALLVMEKLPLDQYVRVGSRATHVQPSRINLVPGEEYLVRDLLYALLLNSANDASVVLAEAVAGSEWKFVSMMNARARQLGAKNTKFANSHGLPTKKVSQYTTAYDMYLIFRQALRFSAFRQMIKVPYKNISSKTGRKIFLKSHNKMLFMGWKNKVYGKTGYTRAAQSCFVGGVEKANSTLIIGVFGCQDRWSFIKRVVSKYGGVAL